MNIYLIECDDSEQAVNIASMYALYAESNEFIEYLEDLTKIDARFVGETITTKISGNVTGKIVGDLSGQSITDSLVWNDNIFGNIQASTNPGGACLFSFKVFNSNKDDCIVIAEAMDVFLKKTRYNQPKV